MSDLFNDIYEVAKLIPPGRVSSYGAIARYLGTGRSARIVGWAMNGAPADVPAHRVVNSQGLLTGKHHFKPPERMQQLLEKEGLRIKDDKIIDFASHLWDPVTELGL